MCIKGYSKKRFIYSEDLKALKKDILKHIKIGLQQIENKEYMTFRDFASLDDIYYSSHFSKVNQDVKITSFSDHNLLYGEFKFK